MAKVTSFYGTVDTIGCLVKKCSRWRLRARTGYVQYPMDMKGGMFYESIEKDGPRGAD